MLLRPFGAMNGCRGGSGASMRRGVAALPLNGAGRIPVSELSGIGVAGSAAAARRRRGRQREQAGEEHAGKHARIVFGAPLARAGRQRGADLVLAREADEQRPRVERRPSTPRPARSSRCRCGPSHEPVQPSPPTRWPATTLVADPEPDRVLQVQVHEGPALAPVVERDVVPAPAVVPLPITVGTR